MTAVLFATGHVDSVGMVSVWVTASKTSVYVHTGPVGNCQQDVMCAQYHFCEAPGRCRVWCARAGRLHHTDKHIEDVACDHRQTG